ncbi:uncharacterized protein [Garra rufa]|uniref:uncharacterized protein n=1 Tax=Garra rufa TaxID=137080 RepID=UPI003CCEDD20
MMLFFVLVTCWIGIGAGAAYATAAGVDEEDDEIESLKVSEGENLTISIQIKKLDEDPQVLVIRLKDSSQERIAQIICHKGVCEHECWRSGVSLLSDGQNITLILMNVNYNQTGLYKICQLSSRHPENKIYNVTVYRKYYTEPPFTTISPEQTPSAMYSKSFTAGISAAAVILIFITAVVIGFIYCKRRKVKRQAALYHDDY